MRLILVACLLLMASEGTAHADHELERRDLKTGSALYAEHCASCHGQDLEGQPNWRSPGPDGVLPAPPHDQNGHTWHHDNQLLFEYTKLGGQAALELRGAQGFKSGMPAFRDLLSDEEIWNILAFIHSTWPQEIKDIQSVRNPAH